MKKRIAKSDSCAMLRMGLFGLVLLSGVLGMTAPTEVLAAPTTNQNPYTEGTAKVRLTPAEKASLLQYADNSKARLEKALKDAEGRSFAEANSIYLKAIKAVIVSSFEQKPRTELLMRIALNQALELTFGVPTADGHLTESAGVLAGISNRDLLTVILEDSIKLALVYYQDDRTAIEKGTLSDLPYMKHAIERLAFARSWLISVTEPVSMYALSVTALQHFMNTAANEDQSHKALYAEELTRVDELLQDNSGTLPTDSKQLMRAVRLLRKELRVLHEDGVKKLVAQGMAIAQVPSSVQGAAEVQEELNQSVGGRATSPRRVWFLTCDAKLEHLNDSPGKHLVTVGVLYLACETKDSESSEEIKFYVTLLDVGPGLGVSLGGEVLITILSPVRTIPDGDWYGLDAEAGFMIGAHAGLFVSGASVALVTGGMFTVRASVGIAQMKFERRRRR